MGAGADGHRCGRELTDAKFAHFYTCPRQPRCRGDAAQHGGVRADIPRSTDVRSDIRGSALWPNGTRLPVERLARSGRFAPRCWWACSSGHPRGRLPRAMSLSSPSRRPGRGWHRAPAVKRRKSFAGSTTRWSSASPKKSTERPATEEAAAPGAEDGGGRPAYRWRGARLQQPVDDGPPAGLGTLQRHLPPDRLGGTPRTRGAARSRL